MTDDIPSTMFYQAVSKGVLFKLNTNAFKFLRNGMIKISIFV
jgi:hypothetical protein